MILTSRELAEALVRFGWEPLAAFTVPACQVRDVGGLEHRYHELAAYHRERGLDTETAHRLAFAEVKEVLAEAMNLAAEGGAGNA